MPTFNFHAKSSDLEFLDIQIKNLMIEIMYNYLLIMLLLHTGDQSTQEKGTK